MALTEQQRKRRTRFIGSSEIAAIVGADPFKNAGDLWLEKTGRLAPTNGNKETARGQRLESLALDWFEERMNVKLLRDIWLDDGKYFCANLDGGVPAGTEVEVVKVPNDLILSPVDAKSTKYIELWGDNVGEIPLTVVCQIQWQMFIIGPHVRRGYVPVLWPKFRDFGFEVPPAVVRDDDLIEGLVYAAHEFYEYIRKDVQPPNATPHIESLKRVKRMPESLISFNPAESELALGIWKQKEGYADTAKGAERDIDEMKAKLLAMLGQYEAARLSDGAMFTYMEQNSQRTIDLDLLQHKLGIVQDGIHRAIERLKNAAPGEALATLQDLKPEALYGELVKQGRHRTLRYKKAPRVKGGSK